MDSEKPTPIEALCQITAQHKLISTNLLVNSKQLFTDGVVERLEMVATDGLDLIRIMAWGKAALATDKHLRLPRVYKISALAVQKTKPEYQVNSLLPYDITIVAGKTEFVSMDNEVAIAMPAWPYCPIAAIGDYLGRRVDVLVTIESIGERKTVKDRPLVELGIKGADGSETVLTLWGEQVDTRLEVGNTVSVSAAFVREFKRRLTLGFCKSVTKILDPQIIAEVKDGQEKPHEPGCSQPSPRKRRLTAGSASPRSYDPNHLEMLARDTPVEILGTVKEAIVNIYTACPRDNCSITTFDGVGDCEMCDQTVHAVPRCFCKVVVNEEDELRAFDEVLTDIFNDMNLTLATVRDEQGEEGLNHALRDGIVGKTCRMYVCKRKVSTRSKTVIDLMDLRVCDSDAGAGESLQVAGVSAPSTPKSKK